MALELTPRQIAVLERLANAGYQIVAFPFYESHVGVKRGNCGALLAPVTSGGMSVFGTAFYLVGGSPSVRINRAGRAYFVFKKIEVEATPERDAELAAFGRELDVALRDADVVGKN